MCKQNHQPKCVTAETDVPGNTGVSCTLGAMAVTWLGPPLPSAEVLARGHPRTGASLFTHSQLLPARRMHGAAQRSSKCKAIKGWGSCLGLDQERGWIGSICGRCDCLLSGPETFPSSLISTFSISGFLKFVTTCLTWPRGKLHMPL